MLWEPGTATGLGPFPGVDPLEAARVVFAELAPSGLPHAVQLVGAAGRETPLLGTAAWCESVLGFTAAPAL